MKKLFFIIIIALASSTLLAQYIDPYELKVGSSYRLSKETPLMPEYEPLNSMQAIAKIKRIPLGSVIKIVSSKKKRNTPWYNVKCGADEGWINCISLAGQSLEKVQPKTLSTQSHQRQETLLKQIKALEAENQRLKKELAEKDQEIKKLRVIIDGNGILDFENELSIKGYDSIPLGADFVDIPKLLNKIEGIDRISGKPEFEKVSGKTYYRYYVNRQVNGELTSSEVALFFKDSKLVQIRDVFGGNYSTIEEGMPWFKYIAEQLKTKWQYPDFEEKTRKTWARDNKTAVLTIQQESGGLPVIKLLIWKD